MCTPSPASQVVQNPRMNADTRNQALIGMSDGIPMFRNKHSRSVTPIAFRAANLPDAISLKFRHIHLAGLYPSEFWRLTDEHETWQRKPRKPSSLIPLLFAIVDDMLHWEDGMWVNDHTLPPSHQDHGFKLRVALLFWCADYPGIAEVSGFVHLTPNKGMCHWCMISGEHSHASNSRVYARYFRYTLNS